MFHATHSILARAVALTSIGRAYMRAAGGDSSRNFATRALEALDITAEVSGDECCFVPATGPLVVVANHPFGVVDGLLLLSLVGRVRRDVRLLGNRLLRHIPELCGSLLPIDVFGRAGHVQQNAGSLRRAIRWLEGGGCLLLFPAGEVAHQAGTGGLTVDSPWQPTAAHLAVRTGARVLPMFVSGRNGRLFRAMGRVHPLLRTALLPHEMWARRGSTVSIRIGEPVTAVTLAQLPDVAACTVLLRSRVDALSTTHGIGEAVRSVSRGWSSDPPADVAIAPRGQVQAIESDIEALQPGVLLESGAYQLFCARAHDLPAVLPEIGRLRELAFRQAGEGTGLARDLDRFDQTYQHLFVWDRVRKEIAGAYRLGATDVVAAGGKVEGLYTRTLFDYDAALVDEIGPALELGRSFVHPRYQRDFSPLLLLWKGISRVVAQSGRYRRLFGVVSVSDRYNSTSRSLMVKFLQTHRFDADLGRLVRAKNPPPPPRGTFVQSTTVSSLEDVCSLVRRIEPDGKDIPVLLRQYLKLNAKLIGFTVDPAFGNVLDGLVVVDLAEVEPAILSRYMGRAEASAFLTRLRSDAYGLAG